MPDIIELDPSDPSYDSLIHLHTQSPSSKSNSKSKSKSKAKAKDTRPSTVDARASELNGQEPLIQKVRPKQSVKEHEDGYDSDEGQAKDEDLPELTPFQEELLHAFLWLVLGCFVFAGLDIATHAQYAQHTSVLPELLRVGNFAPGSAFVIFFTNRYAETYLGQAQLFLMSTLGGSYLINIINTASYVKVMQQAPPLGVLWMWAVVKLDLMPAVLSLAAVAGWCWYADMDFYTLKV